MRKTKKVCQFIDNYHGIVFCETENDNDTYDVMSGLNYFGNDFKMKEIRVDINHKCVDIYHLVRTY